MKPFTMTLPGAPRTKKNSGKIWKVGKRTVIKPSQAWLTWRDFVLAHLLIAHRFTMRNICPLPDVNYNCEAIFYRDANRGDAVGYYQGLADVLEDCKILSDDKFITQWDGSRMCVDKKNPRVEFTLTPITPTEI